MKLACYSNSGNRVLALRFDQREMEAIAKRYGAAAQYELRRSGPRWIAAKTDGDGAKIAAQDSPGPEMRVANENLLAGVDSFGITPAKHRLTAAGISFVLPKNRKPIAARDHRRDKPADRQRQAAPDHGGDSTELLRSAVEYLNSNRKRFGLKFRIGRDGALTVTLTLK